MFRELGVKNKGWEEEPFVAGSARVLDRSRRQGRFTLRVWMHRRTTSVPFEAAAMAPGWHRSRRSCPIAAACAASRPTPSVGTPVAGGYSRSRSASVQLDSSIESMVRMQEGATTAREPLNAPQVLRRVQGRRCSGDGGQLGAVARGVAGELSRAGARSITATARGCRPASASGCAREQEDAELRKQRELL